jgi:hypothetical protein
MCTGSEVSLFTTGFFPGDTLEERMALLADPTHIRAAVPQARAQMKIFLQRAVEIVRARFSGPVSYASIPFEGVDWSLFDIVATDAGYRNAATRARYPELMRAFVEQGRALRKPVAITEFGCGTYRGAGDASAMNDSTIVWDDHARAIGLNGDLVRDEGEQATYLRELLEVYDAEGIDAAFVYTFARYDLPHRVAPGVDIDMASAGIVKVLDDSSSAHDRRYPDMPWEPKAAFDALAQHYGRYSS